MRMRAVVISAAMVLELGVAAAQPGAWAPPPGAGAAPPPVPAPYAYEPSSSGLSDEDQSVLARGEIDDRQYIVGGLAASFLGLGVGHAIQGRWSERGWIFTVGEIAAYGVFAWGYAKAWECGCDGAAGVAVAGLLAAGGLRLFEIADAWVEPPAHNQRVRSLRRRYPVASPGTGLYLSPPQSHERGGVAGLSLRF